MDAREREEILLDIVRSPKRKRRKMLKQYGIPSSTYYAWRRLRADKGPEGLKLMSKTAKHIWGKLIPEEIEMIRRESLGHPELSSRELAMRITDEGKCYVSESTIYRLLKKWGLIKPTPLPSLPASDEWHKKTTRINELWQCDFTYLFVAGWGWYYLISVMDDYSRKILDWELCSDMTSETISTVIQRAAEITGCDKVPVQYRPMLLSDNGSGFIGKALAKTLNALGMRHIFGAPYHPQTQGKIERYNRSTKERVNLLVYFSPDALRQAIAECVNHHNNRYHEGIGNVSPNDVYYGLKDAILKRRAEVKKETLERRKRYNLGLGVTQTND